MSAAGMGNVIGTLIMAKVATDVASGIGKQSGARKTSIKKVSTKKIGSRKRSMNPKRQRKMSRGGMKNLNF